MLIGLLGCQGSKAEKDSDLPETETPAVVQLENEPTRIPITPSPAKDPLLPLIATIQSRGGKVSGNETGVTAIDWQHAPINNLDLELLTEVPLLKRLYLPGVKVDSRGWVYLSTLPNLERLALWNTPITDEDLKNLAGAKTLEVLDLNRTKISGQGLAHLVDCRNLQTLLLSNTHCGRQSLPHLARLKSLRVLDLLGTGVKGSMIAPLKDLPNLEELRMRIEPIALQQMTMFPNIRRLELRSRDYASLMNHFPLISRLPVLESLQITAQGNQDLFLQHVANCPRLRDLRVNGRVKFTDRGLAQLSDCRTLRLLDVREATVTLAGLRQIAQANREVRILVHPITLHNLRDAFESMGLGARHSGDGGPRLVLDRELNIAALRLEDAKIFLPSLKLIAKAIDPEKLEYLGLGHTGLTDEGLASFRAGANLKHVNLSGTKITTQGLKTWGGGNYPELPRLETLDLSGCRLDDDCLAWIGTLDQLKTLRLKDVQGVTEAGWAHLGRLENLERLDK